VETGLTDYLRIGKRLRKLREEKGYSLYDVERISSGEFKVPTLASYETAKRKISISRISKLAALYKVSLDSMLGEARVAEKAPDYGSLSPEELKELENKIRALRKRLERKGRR
jgi:transcriptional regulator with XRE-family HTH domain